ncbi:hypothetical protein OHS71_40840 [Streptomyces sp. NBC_00377]|uniref:hypothetical protein n=1 Tax=unclassified Streptomyces TaxID=2593676 RepID=UPI002E20493B|nr:MULTISPECIES: hypothetical protein [unclassified Streptomyces]
MRQPYALLAVARLAGDGTLRATVERLSRDVGPIVADEIAVIAGLAPAEQALLTGIDRDHRLKIDAVLAERTDVALRLPRLEFDTACVDDSVASGVLRRTAGDCEHHVGNHRQDHRVDLAVPRPSSR